MTQVSTVENWVALAFANCQMEQGKNER
jgi:hypothetical protein